jgi:putative PIN family toxin of toxin-antitoxin system
MSDPRLRPRVVFDCNTLVQAVAFDNGPAAACLALAESGSVELYVSRPTLSELRRVLQYTEVRAMSPNMTATRVTAFLQRLTFRATLVRRVRHAIDYPRDPDDEPYLDLAIAVHAGFLVSRDKDLLSLRHGHSAVCKEFRRKARGLQVMTPQAFLVAVGRPWNPGRND